MNPGRLELRSLRRRNLREEATEVLRAAILGGDLEPGSIQSVVGLAEIMNVSPTPVREAMLELARVGLIEVLPNRGFRVTVVDDHDLDEIASLRKMLEVPAMRLIVEKATDDDLALLTQPLGVVEAAAEANDVPAFLLADREFHLGLLRLSASERLVAIVAGLRDQARIVGLHSLAVTGALRASAPEHRQIFEAVRARDGDQAERLMSAHLEHTRGLWAGRKESRPK
jgi:DNA-binding GntR family transcriptional regulator